MRDRNRSKPETVANSAKQLLQNTGTCAQILPKTTAKIASNLNYLDNNQRSFKRLLVPKARIIHNQKNIWKIESRAIHAEKLRGT